MDTWIQMRDPLLCDWDDPIRKAEMYDREMLEGAREHDKRMDEWYELEKLELARM